MQNVALIIGGVFRNAAAGNILAVDKWEQFIFNSLKIFFCFIFLPELQKDQPHERFRKPARQHTRPGRIHQSVAWRYGSRTCVSSLRHQRRTYCFRSSIVVRPSCQKTSGGEQPNKKRPASSAFASKNCHSMIMSIRTPAAAAPPLPTL